MIKMNLHPSTKQGYQIKTVNNSFLKCPICQSISLSDSLGEKLTAEVSICRNVLSKESNSLIILADKKNVP